VKVPENNDPKAEKAMMVRVASQPTSGGSTVATGADVSRFQRSTVPGKPADTTGPNAQGAPPSTGFPGSSVSLGPVVHVARGNTVTDVSVGGKK
jgi:pilus assembly protein CpaB